MKGVSILIPVFNNSKFTEDCINSIYLTTKVPIEIIVIDNGSTDDTEDVLLQLKQNCPNNIRKFKIIKNKKNRGVISAFNQGINIFIGDYLLLQNNDCLMTPNWLEEMMKVINQESNIGIVGPLTNLFKGKSHPNPQLVYPEYKSLNELNNFAISLRNKQKKLYSEVDYVFGHCMLISRKVIEDIGNFDTRFGIGYFEEIDYCKRAKDKGYKIVVANHSFIHHFGNKTLDLLNINRDELKKTNQKIFCDKWKIQFNDTL